MPNVQHYNFTPVWPHGKIQEVFPDIFYVTGTNKVHHDGLDIQTSRNMVIYRNGSELTLINTVRLNEVGLKELERLGTVTHIVRIGAFHGRDDAFYRTHYPDSKLWALEGITYENGLEADKYMTSEVTLPFPGCFLFVYETSRLPEGVLLIDREGGILITCDSIQNITATDEFYNLETARSFLEQGLVKSANISPIWLGATQTQAIDFCRLLQTMKFKHLITAHGEPLLNEAYQKVSESVKRVFS